MSGRWHEVAADGRHRIVAFDPDTGTATHYAVTTCDGAVLRRELSLPEARAWLEHFARQDPHPHPPASMRRRAR